MAALPQLTGLGTARNINDLPLVEITAPTHDGERFR